MYECEKRVRVKKKGGDFGFGSVVLQLGFFYFVGNFLTQFLIFLIL